MVRRLFSSIVGTAGIIATATVVALVVGQIIGLAQASSQVFAKEHSSTYEIVRGQEINNPNRDYLILVNQKNPYRFGDYYDINLQKDLVFMVNDVDGDTMAAEKAAYLSYTMLKRDLADMGIKVGIYDGYRSAADQEYLNDFVTATAYNPGYTEHHTGLLLTIVMWDDKTNAWATTLDNPNVRKGFGVMHEKAADYGFILRYPEGKESVTGLAYRPAEMRYVGTAETAHAIMDSGLTLEEYLADLN